MKKSIDSSAWDIPDVVDDEWAARRQFQRTRAPMTAFASAGISSVSSPALRIYVAGALIMDLFPRLYNPNSLIN